MKTLGLILNFKSKSTAQQLKAQHSVLITILHKQGYREVKLHVILVGMSGTIDKDHTGKPLADLNLNYQKVKKLTHKLHEHSIRHASTLKEIQYALQYNLSNTSQGAGLGATAHNPPDPHNIFFRVCLRGGGLPGAGT